MTFMGLDSITQYRLDCINAMQKEVFLGGGGSGGRLLVLSQIVVYSRQVSCVVVMKVGIILRVLYVCGVIISVRRSCMGVKFECLK